MYIEHPWTKSNSIFLSILEILFSLKVSLKEVYVHVHNRINIHIFWMLLKWWFMYPVVRIAWKVLAHSWRLRLSSGAKFYTMFMLASTGRYRKDVRKDGDNLPLRNTCVTNDHGYVPLVVSTFQYFSHSWLISDFVTGSTPRVLLVEQEVLTLPGHVSSPPIFSFLCSIL